jgi:hypothetical protein
VQREEAMRSGAGGEFDMTAVAEISKGFDEITLPFVYEKRAETEESILIHFGKFTEPGDIAPLDLITTEAKSAINISQSSSLE